MNFLKKFFLLNCRGCLFYGPPGTGKTLVARALANECSRGDRKVTFFMRSAADCMSKWVGESERQLRLVFEQVRLNHATCSLGIVTSFLWSGRTHSSSCSVISFHWNGIVSVPFFNGVSWDVLKILVKQTRKLPPTLPSKNPTTIHTT